MQQNYIATLQTLNQANVEYIDATNESVHYNLQSFKDNLYYFEWQKLNPDSEEAKYILSQMSE
jgi:hypothetical protein